MSLGAGEAGAVVDEHYGDLEPIFKAGRDGRCAEVERLLQRMPALAKAVHPSTGMTLLHQAARHGCTALVGRLLASGASVNARNRWGLTPLHYAARFGHPEVARLLLEHGADADARASGGQTPLEWALVFERPEVVQLLLARGAEVSPFAAAALGDVERLEEWLDRDPAVVEARNEWQGTPLHVAALAGQRATVALLLSRGADLAARDVRGRTPLDHARDPEVRQLLAAAGAREPRRAPVKGEARDPQSTPGTPPHPEEREAP